MAQSPTLTPGWGRASGALELQHPPSLTDDRGQAVAERELILAAVKQYTWAYDERDKDQLAAAFTPDAVFDGAIAGGGPVGPHRGRVAVVQWLEGYMDAQTDQRRHACMNHVITRQDPQQARVLSTLVLTSATAATVRLVTTGFYRFDLRKTQIWRISHIHAGFDQPF